MHDGADYRYPWYCPSKQDTWPSDTGAIKTIHNTPKSTTAAPAVHKKPHGDKVELDVFVATMLEHFPDHDLTYSFKEMVFSNPKTNDMFNIWKLGRQSL